MVSFGLGLATLNRTGDLLDVYYPTPLLDPDPGLVALWRQAYPALETSDWVLIDAKGAEAEPSLRAELNPFHQALDESNPHQGLIVTVLVEDAPIASTAGAYLKLHLLSHRLAKPNALNLEGIYAHMPNVAWSNEGPIDLSELSQRQLETRLAGRTLEITSIDKFPKMTNYVVPEGVRIADAARVRLGAYVGEGTTVMHEGFINFNAGAEGPNMVEGRISQGVYVGKGSDLGGSASTAGTLSGGGNVVITIGEDCLISANAGTGISLGDRCTIEAGLYITPGTVVEVLDDTLSPVRKIKARELSGESDLLFIRHSQTGQVQCRTNKKAIALNEMLHTHN